MLKRLNVGSLPADFVAALRGFDAATGSVAAVSAAFTGQEVARIALGSEADVTAAFARARAEQARWGALDVGQRAAVMLRFHDLVLSHRELLCDIIQIETGKNRASALDEVLDVAINSRYYAKNAKKFLAEGRGPGALPIVTKTRKIVKPVGVVGQISPWNYPLTLSTSDAVAALMAGNTVVSKPDKNTPFTALLARYLLAQAGLPDDAMIIVNGEGSVVGDAIARQCDYLMFTGSTATGRILGAIAGERLIGYSAELGGKNPLIVAGDVDIPTALRDIPSACFSNTGQLCISIERMYVVDSVYDTFVPQFIAAVEKMAVGAGLRWDIDMGSLINRTQLERVSEMVDEAVAAGATVLTGAKPLPELGPYFYAPTVLTDVPETAALHREEVFGPVVYIERVKDEAEAVARANDSRYGLNASVFAAAETGWDIARQLASGAVGINDGYAAAFASVAHPSGGVKDSGLGRRHGREGLLKYTESTTIAQQRFVSMRGPTGLSPKRYAGVMATALRLGKRFLP